MSPGVEWRPFEIAEKEYQEILNDILERKRQGSLPGPYGTKIENIIIDKDFDNYTDLLERMIFSQCMSTMLGIRLRE